MPDATRHSHAFDPEIISDPEERARQEALNGLKQFDTVIKMVETFLDPERQPFKLRPSHLLQLHREALAGISNYAGNWRPSEIKIGGSRHTPPGAFEVPEKIEELCDYVNEEWSEKSPLHLASYVMWRLNWIHPFADGNGRTSRAVAYMVLCVKLGYILPGKKTIPAQIAENRTPYYKALEAADIAYKEGKIDLSAMKELLSSMLAKQLYEVHEDAKLGED
ncbi:Fic family protein [Terracidiphilus gabretensis]|uniref:Fic family protein n=1 Tax=Terracidiphilus gabretensis TaxID=1577687 RepID=UPI00071B9E35|nr:Fic family protein [Terracidiphilus gabretensis]